MKPGTKRSSILLPLVAVSLARGSPPPEAGPLAKYYQAEKHLSLCGNLFLLSLIATAIGKLGLHFGYIEQGWAGRIELATGVPFGILLLSFAALWIRAACKIRKQAEPSR